jgi:hypothetical protein
VAAGNPAGTTELMEGSIPVRWWQMCCAGGCTMAKRTVSPRIIWLVFFTIYGIIALLQTPVLAGWIDTGNYAYCVIRFIAILMVSYVLARLFVRFLGLVGLSLRSRSVERLKPAAHGGLDESRIDLPIRVPYRYSFTFRLGAVGLLVMCPVSLWYPPPSVDDRAPLLRPIGAICCGLAGSVGIVRSLQRRIVCEITAEGISAPNDYGSRITFVPWENLVSCEFIFDDASSLCDHFVLWDKAGRPRFRSSGTWLTYVTPADRSRIFRALKSRYST